MKNWFKKWLPALLIALGAAFILFRLIPGGLTLQDAIQNAGAPLAGDGELVISTGAYANLQRAALWAGLFILGAGLLARYVWARRPAWERPLAWGMALVGALVLVLGANTVIARSDSLVYRVFVVQPAAGPRSTRTPVPTETPIPTPRPTLDLTGPGRWVPYVKSQVQPVAMVPYPGTDDAYLVVQKNGIIRYLEGGVLRDEVFMDLRDRVLQLLQSYEQGLLGLAFHPDFEQNGYLYVSYTNATGHLVFARFEVSEDPYRGDPDSEAEILTVFQEGPTHQGGSLRFGPDGLLYIGLGDGRNRPEPLGHAQSIDNPYGKILRIDVDGPFPYGIPPENPFASVSGLDEIFVYGLRNPWQFTFDSATGDMYIADVGQNTSEEVNFIPAGHPGGINFGWSLREGFEPFNLPLATALPGRILTDPIWAYPQEGENCAIVGGHVYHGEAFLELQDAYIFGDFCSGLIWSLQRDPSGQWQHSTLFDTEMNITSFTIGHDGELYATDFRDQIWRWIP